jgi:accessory secretory protein Asp2
MPRKFNVLQIGGTDLEYLFTHKPEVTWDYFDTQLFEFDSGYIDSIKEIVDHSHLANIVHRQVYYMDDSQYARVVLMHLSGSLDG